MEHTVTCSAATCSLECSGHQGPAQEADERESGSKGGAEEEGKDVGALTKPWAWPLVNAEAPALARYEALARQLVARHGLAGGALSMRTNPKFPMSWDSAGAL